MQIRHLASVLSLLAIMGMTAAPVRASDSTQLAMALKSMPAQADKFRSMMSNLNASQFHLVNAASIENSEYKSAIKKNASQLSDLRETLAHTTLTGDDGVVVSLRKVLQQKNITIDQVIGVYVGADGQITLFYQ